MLAPHITAVCREYAGRRVVRNGRAQLVEERCGQCPLRTPCLKWGGAPARTEAEMAESREAFAVEATEILNAQGGK